MLLGSALQPGTWAGVQPQLLLHMKGPSHVGPRRLTVSTRPGHVTAAFKGWKWRKTTSGDSLRTQWAFMVVQPLMSPPANAGNTGSIPALGRVPLMRGSGTTPLRPCSRAWEPRREKSECLRAHELQPSACTLQQEKPPQREVGLHNQE